MTPPTQLTYQLRPAAGEPDGALVLLHGRGTDEHDLEPFVQTLDPTRRLVGVTPRGPISLPGDPGAHWYLPQRIGFPDPATFHQSLALLGDWLDGLSGELAVPIERTVLGGFSQGAVMAYALGLGRGRPSPAGVMALSGFIGTVHDFELDLESRAALPVLIAHGSNDRVIDVDFGRRAAEQLAAAGLAVTYRESPAAHHIDPRELDVLRDWVERVLVDAPAS